MMKLSNNVERLLELVSAAADTSNMARIIYIENARIIAADLNKKEWAQVVKLSKPLNAIQFNMLIAIGIKKPYRAEIFKGRMDRFD